MMPTLDSGIIEHTNCCAPCPMTIAPQSVCSETCMVERLSVPTKEQKTNQHLSH
ncbi:hypothetical protein A79_3111 [Vibrio parahaemolyticus AQ3810]|nr:hypothetical protein A79_3111 [Vibrio parahaemolyticus AQ3810]